MNLGAAHVGSRVLWCEQCNGKIQIVTIPLPQASQSMLEAASVVLERERVDLSNLVWVQEGDSGSAALESAEVLLRGGCLTCEVLTRELAAVLVRAGETR